MTWLISEVSLCDYGDGEAGSCLTDKTNNTSHDAEEHIVTRCNGCGRTHNCAVISTMRLELKNGVVLASGMAATSKRRPRNTGKNAGLKKPAAKKKNAAR